MKKVFFSASIHAMPQLMENYKLIIREITRNNVEVVDKWWLKNWNEITKEYQRKGKGNIKRKDILKKVDSSVFFKNYMSKIESCDMLIAEISRPSIAVGYQIFYATAYKKPVLALYSKDGSDVGDIRSIISTNSPYVILKKYSKKTLPYIINRFLGKKNPVLKKFNFIISEEIDDYLNWLNKIEPEKSKSELLRDKIEKEVIVNDEDYLKQVKIN